MLTKYWWKIVGVWMLIGAGVIGLIAIGIAREWSAFCSLLVLGVGLTGYLLWLFAPEKRR